MTSRMRMRKTERNQQIKTITEDLRKMTRRGQHCFYKTERGREGEGNNVMFGGYAIQSCAIDISGQGWSELGNNSELDWWSCLSCSFFQPGHSVLFYSGLDHVCAVLGWASGAGLSVSIWCLTVCETVCTYVCVCERDCLYVCVVFSVRRVV